MSPTSIDSFETIPQQLKARLASLFMRLGRVKLHPRFRLELLKRASHQNANNYDTRIQSQSGPPSRFHLSAFHHPSLGKSASFIPKRAHVLAPLLFTVRCIDVLYCAPRLSFPFLSLSHAWAGSPPSRPCAHLLFRWVIVHSLSRCRSSCTCQSFSFLLFIFISVLPSGRMMLHKNTT